jgi:hypothetical protein
MENVCERRSFEAGLPVRHSPGWTKGSLLSSVTRAVGNPRQIRMYCVGLLVSCLVMLRDGGMCKCSAYSVQRTHTVIKETDSENGNKTSTITK